MGRLRQHSGGVVVMALILFGRGLGWTLVLVPVIFLMLAVAAMGGGLPAAHHSTGRLTTRVLLLPAAAFDVLEAGFDPRLEGRASGQSRP